jgi:hypothetical protein
LAAVVNHHLNKSELYVAQQIQDNIYVDNILLGFQDAGGLFLLYSQIKEEFGRANLNVREFVFNADYSQFPADDQLPASKAKLLGVKWNTDKDQLEILLPALMPGSKITKRTALSHVATPFDPLGLISPGLLPARLFLQSIWELKLGWDEALPKDKQQEWFEIAATWNNISFTVPRHVHTPTTWTDSTALHVFADASGHGMGIAIYVRGENGQGQISSHLIFGKSLILPQKLQASIPRAELQATYLAAQCLRFVLGELLVSATPKLQIWTDSKCVIDWLVSKRLISRFEDNRLRAIKDYPVAHVVSEENPADVASRGLIPSELLHSKLWFEGPSWLTNPEATWPTPLVSYQPSADAEDDWPIQQQLVAAADPEPTLIDFERFSDWKRLLRITVYVIRLCVCYRNSTGTRQFFSKNDDGLSSTEFRLAFRPHPIRLRELKVAKGALIKQAQQEHPPSEETKRSLGICCSDDGMLRCFGRFGKSNINPLAVTPIYLPPKSRVTALYVLNLHLKLLHAGPLIVLAELRKAFWLPQGRRNIRSILISNPKTRCYRCYRGSLRPYTTPPEPPLP